MASKSPKKPKVAQKPKTKLFHTETSRNFEQALEILTKNKKVPFLSDGMDTDYPDVGFCGEFWWSVNDEPVPDHEFVRLSQGDFLKMVGDLPEEKKINFYWNGRDCSVGLEQIQVGCQIISKSDFQKVEKTVNALESLKFLEIENGGIEFVVNEILFFDEEYVRLESLRELIDLVNEAWVKM